MNESFVFAFSCSFFFWVKGCFVIGDVAMNQLDQAPPSWGPHSSWGDTQQMKTQITKMVVNTARRNTVKENITNMNLTTES